MAVEDGDTAVTPAPLPRRIDRASQWASRLAILVAGFLVFETLTGLSIYLLPFSVPNQIMVLLHTGAGLLFVFFYLFYQLKHWLLYRRYSLTPIKLMGYIALAAVALCGVSGLALTYEALFGRQITRAWNIVHIVTTFAIIAFLVPHVLLIVLRDRKTKDNPTVAPALRAAKTYTWGYVGLTALLFAMVGVSYATYRPVEFRNEFPEGYSMPFGKDRPFAPSLATTDTGGAFDSRSLSGSKSCGQSGCHEDIYHEWSVSAHRWASMDPAFQGIQNVMAKQNGAESTRYCGGCHDPISLFSGTKNIDTPHLSNLAGYNEGVSCIACHAIKKTDIKGNANYVIRQPERYMFEGKPGKLAQTASNFLIRAYPKGHVETFNHRLFKSPEFCAACHKQFIDKEVNKVGWVQLQNQFDNWRKSHWNTKNNPRKTVECRECHMPLQKNRSETLARVPGDYNRASYDGKHRSHRFLGANQFIPPVLKMEGWEEQTRLTEQWLQGKIEIPEIADKWRSGPAVPIKIIAPSAVRASEPVNLTVNINSNKVGHDFPTGPLDIIQCWIEISAKDETGKVVYATGRLDERKFVEKGSFIFRAEPVDQYGNLIERHNLWEMVGVRYKRALFPGFSDKAQFTFSCPGGDAGPLPPERTFQPTQKFAMDLPEGVTGRLHVTAKLRYRKIGQFLVNFVFGEEKGLTTPVTDMSVATAVIEVVPRGGKLPPAPRSVASVNAAAAAATGAAVTR